MSNGTVDNRLEIKLLQNNIQIAQLQKKIKIGKFLPQIGFAGTYNWFGNIDLKVGGTGLQSIMSSLPPEVLSALASLPLMGNGFEYKIKSNKPLLMLSIKVPITDWIGGSKAIKRSKLEIENAQLDLKENKRLMTLELRQASMKLTTSLELIESSTKALQTATE